MDIEQWRISKNGRDIAIAEAFEYKPNEFFVMKLANAVEKGKYIIDLRKYILSTYQENIAFVTKNDLNNAKYISKMPEIYQDLNPENHC